MQFFHRAGGDHEISRTVNREGRKGDGMVTTLCQPGKVVETLILQGRDSMAGARVLRQVSQIWQSCDRSRKSVHRFAFLPISGNRLWTVTESSGQGIPPQGCASQSHDGNQFECHHCLHQKHQRYFHDRS